MARSKSFFDEVKNHLECSACQEQFSEINEPKILKCLHTFCKTCLEAWLRQQREGELNCPTCRQITECPDNIQSLPSNLFFKQLVEIAEAYSGQGQEDSPHCGICDEKKSLKFYCSDCNSFLCDDCVSSHKKGKVFKGHHVKEIGNFESSDVQDYARRANVCKKHKDEMRFYCERCQICICRDCAILEHQDHNKISLYQGLENNKSEIEARMRKVEENGSRLKSYKDFLEKRRLKVNSSIEETTKEVKRVAEHRILLIRQHEASVTKRLVEQKAALQDAFDTQMTSLDGKLMEIKNTLAFSEEVLLRKNLPEVLNVKATIEQRLQELSVPFEAMPTLGCSGVKYVQSDVSSLKDAPGKLVTTDTEPSLSVAEGKSLTEGLVDKDCTFTVTTKNSAGQTTYSEIDEVSVKITSLAKNKKTKTLLTDLKDGRYSISYRPTTSGDFTVSIEVGGTPIMGSPFKLKVKPISKGNQDLDGNRQQGNVTTVGEHDELSGTPAGVHGQSDNPPSEKGADFLGIQAAKKKTKPAIKAGVEISRIFQPKMSVKQIEPENGVTVVFHVLLATDLTLEKEGLHIRAQGSELGGYCENCVDLSLTGSGESKDEKKLNCFTGQFTLSLERARRGTSYKYVVVNKGVVHWECLLEFSPKYRGGVVCRFLCIPEKCLKPGAKWHQFDGVAYIYRGKRWWEQIYDYFRREETVKNRTTALLTYLPKWNGFHVNELGEKMTATEALVELDKVVSCLTNVWVKEIDFPATKRKPADFNIQTVLVDLMEPKLKENAAVSAENKADWNSRASALVSSLAIVVLLKKYNLRLQKEYQLLLLKCLVLEGDPTPPNCTMYEVLCEEFSEELRAYAAEGIEELRNESMAIPLLHFLRRNSNPFEEPAT